MLNLPAVAKESRHNFPSNAKIKTSSITRATLIAFLDYFCTMMFVYSSSTNFLSTFVLLRNMSGVSQTVIIETTKLRARYDGS